MDWQNKVVLITGAASGMGLAFARRFAAAGASLALADIQAERVAATAQSLAKDALAIAADVARVADCAAMVAAAVARFGRLDLLINSAGVWVEGPAEEMGEAEWDRCVDINLKGTFFACRYAIPELRKTAGVIINIASDAGLMGNAGASIYCASKGGVAQLTGPWPSSSPRRRTLQRHLPLRCRYPHAGGPGRRLRPRDPEGYTRKLRAIYPQGDRTRFVRPEEVADFVFAVAGLEPITGACLPIDFATTAGGDRESRTSSLRYCACVRDSCGEARSLYPSWSAQADHPRVWKVWITVRRNAEILARFVPPPVRLHHGGTEITELLLRASVVHFLGTTRPAADKLVDGRPSPTMTVGRAGPADCDRSRLTRRMS